MYGSHSGNSKNPAFFFFGHSESTQSSIWAPFLSDITEGTKQVNNFTVKKLRWVSLISQFVHKSHCTECPGKKQTNKPPQKPNSKPGLGPCCFRALQTNYKHSRLQTSLGKVREYVIFIKGSTEGRNSSRMTEMDGILLLMAEKRG